MKIYKDLFSETEVGSDSYPTTILNDVVLQLQGKEVVVGNEDYGISSNVDEDADEGATGEDLASSKKTVINFVQAYNFQEVGKYSKKDFMNHIKVYMTKITTRLQANNPDRVDAFKKGAQTFVKKLLEDYDQYDMYTNEHYDLENCLFLVRYIDNIPYLYVWKDAITEEKV